MPLYIHFNQRAYFYVTVRRREHNSTLQDTLHCSHRILGMDDISSSSKTGIMIFDRECIACLL